MNGAQRAHFWLWALLLLAVLAAAVALLTSVPRIYSQSHAEYLTRMS
jgi:hypothetical protein